jgi:hypothetical protein
MAGSLAGQELASGRATLLTASLTKTEPAQARSLKSALSELELKYKVSIMADQELIEGKLIANLGPYKTLEDALRILLNGTNLQFEKISKKVYVISPVVRQEQSYIRELEMRQPGMPENNPAGGSFPGIESRSQKSIPAMPGKCGSTLG